MSSSIAFQCSSFSSLNIRYVIGCALRSIPSIPVLMVSAILTAIASIPTGMMLPSLLIDCMDYNEWKTGERVEAVFSSMNSVSTKIGSGMASVLAGFIMGIAGYNGMHDVQTARANTSIVALYAWIPMVMFVVMILLMRFYRIDKEMVQARKELEERRKHSAGANVME